MGIRSVLRPGDLGEIVRLHGVTYACEYGFDEIVTPSPDRAQLRWFLVGPAVRGRGLRGALLQEAVDFCRKCEYSSVFLWTVSLLRDAARRYEKQGFHRVESPPGRCWGVDLAEEKYRLALQPGDTPVSLCIAGPLQSSEDGTKFSR